MNALKKAVGLAVAVMLTSGTVYGQESVATLSAANGTVLVSQGDAMVAGATNQSLRVGTRVVTSAGSTATIQYANGCTVPLGENQRFVVRAAGTCASLIAGVEGTGVGAAGAGAAGTGAAGGGAAVAGGAAIGGTTAIIGGVVAVAAIGGVVAANKSSNTSSPN